MIPGTFEYFRPKSVSEAAKLLHKSKNSSVLAGGHSLLPMMKLRVAAPSDWLISRALQRSAASRRLAAIL